MKNAFILFSALFGIAFTLASGVYQLVQARNMRRAGHPQAAARAIMGWAGVALAVLTAVLVFLNAR